MKISSLGSGVMKAAIGQTIWYGSVLAQVSRFLGEFWQIGTVLCVHDCYLMIWSVSFNHQKVHNIAPMSENDIHEEVYQEQ